MTVNADGTNELTIELQRLADRLAIQDVIALYALGQDGHQGDDNAVLEQWDLVFTEDATTDNTEAGAPISSYRDQLVWMRGDGKQPGRMSEFSHWQHMMSLPVVSIAGDAAEARTDFLAIEKVKVTNGARGSVLIAPGAFHDSLIRTPEGWRIKHRRYEVYFADVVETVPAKGHSEST
jgi:hypothetical protein